MNLIDEIARGAKEGLTAVEMAAKLRAEKGLEVGEAWVRKIMGADGFAAVVERIGKEAAAGKSPETFPQPEAKK